MYARSFQIFHQESLSRFLGDRLKKIESQVLAQAEDYILNVNETEYVKHLVNQGLIENLELDFEAVFASPDSRKVPAEHFPSGLWNVTRGKSYERNVYRYHIPFTGEAELLRYSPSTGILWTTEVSVQGRELCFDLVDFHGSAEGIRNRASETQESIRKQWDYVRREVAVFNAALESKIRSIFLNRKEHFLKRNDLMASLGVPIKKRENLPQTFAVPTPATRKKLSVAKPVVTEKGYRPEPTLEDSTYREILRYLHDWGKQLERMPSTYSGKSEEDLRDMFLVFIEPHFQGTATGETFNKSGKTDILLRFEGKNVFVAECKRWKGQQSYLDAISQLLGYLTWRDSKAAVMMFVSNKEISSVLGTVERATLEHPNCLGFVSKQEGSWLNYRFHLDGDPNREVKLAVLLFHYPEK